VIFVLHFLKKPQFKIAGRFLQITLPLSHEHTGSTQAISLLFESQNSRKFGNIVPGVFTPVLAKHTKSFNLVDTLSVGVDRIQRNFEPLQRQVELWRKTQITDDTAKLIFYSAFIDGKLEAPRSLLPEVHRLYFEPQYPEFAARTMWSLSNAFTSAFKKLDPIPQFKATAKLGAFLAQLPN
jgi:hypothetical protein